jgi:hypothetical protein
MFADPELEKSVADKIEEAKLNGSAKLDGNGNNIELTKKGEDVIMDDKTNNETTVAKDKGNGEVELQGVPNTAHSATQKDVEVPLPEHSSTGKATTGTQKDMKVTIEEAIEDRDKAGMERSFSVVFDGFSSQEEANEFYSDIVGLQEENDALYSELEDLEESSLTFSDDELEGIADTMNQVKEFSERIMSSPEGIELAHQVINAAESMKSYSVLAEEAGHDLSDVYEAAVAYSEYADECLTQIYSNMDIQEYFSELDEDEMNAYFSGLDEVQSSVLADALENGVSMTFSELEDEVNAVYSELELETPILECFSSEEELDAYFSNLEPNEYNLVFSLLNEDETLTFSELNEALYELNQPLDEMFSEMDEEELATFSEAYGEEFTNMAFSMADDDEYVYTFSDFVDAMEETLEFSDEDAETLANNSTEIVKAADDMKATQDPELAKKVKLLAEDTKELTKEASDQGHDVEVVEKAMSEIITEADQVLVNNGIIPDSVYSEDVQVFSEYDEVEDAVYSDEDVLEEQYQYSDEEADDTRIFADTTVPTKNSTFSSCLTAKF